jgi:hypothetical protein
VIANDFGQSFSVIGSGRQAVYSACLKRFELLSKLALILGDLLEIGQRPCRYGLKVIRDAPQLLENYAHGFPEYSYPKL